MMTRTIFHRGFRWTVFWWLTVAMTIIDNIQHVEGNNPGPEYTKAVRQCRQTADCLLLSGEVCWSYYDGCPRGRCMCDPRYAYRDAGGICRAKKFGEQPCWPDGSCPNGLTCNNGRCLCLDGTLSSDGTYCVNPRQRLLGQTCHPYHHTCLQRAAHGYVTSEVECTPYGRCQCIEGYKQDGSHCRRWNIGEPGCSKDHQCQGGALCIDGVCRCPNGYIPVASNSKCARFGATVELGVRATCDEIGERRYCAAKLVCHQCSGQSHYTCVHFADSVTPLVSGAQTGPAPSQRLFITSTSVLLAALLSRWLSCR